MSTGVSLGKYSSACARRKRGGRTLPRGLIASVGPVRFRRLLETLTCNIATPTTSKFFSDAMTVCDHFAQDPGKLLYLFTNGVYKPVGEAFVEGRVKALMAAWDILDRWNSGMASEIVKFLQVDAPKLWEIPSPDLINVSNGLLNIRTRTLKPHSPDFLSPVQLPVQFDPKARCPQWEWFIKSVVA
jgi:putative DNA primase/helicase